MTLQIPGGLGSQGILISISGSEQEGPPPTSVWQLWTNGWAIRQRRKPLGSALLQAHEIWWHTDFITLTSKEPEKAVEGRQTGTKFPPFSTLIILWIFWSNFHILFSFFLYPEHKKTFCNIISCSWQTSKPQ